MGNFFEDIGSPIGGDIANLFNRDPMEAPKRLQEPWQIEMQQYLAGLSKTGAGEAITKAGTAYPGSLTTSYEDIGLGTLGEYLSSPLPTESNLFGLSSAELEKTLSGKEYDPATGPYYEAYRTNIMRELQQAKDRIAARSSSRDAFFGGGRLDQEREVEEGAMGSMAQELGRLYEGERARRLNAVPTALQTMGWAEQVPQGRVAASQEYGGLEFQRGYSEYVRQLASLGIPLEMASKLAMYAPEYYQPGYEPSTFEQYLMPLLQAGAQGAGRAAAGGM